MELVHLFSILIILLILSEVFRRNKLATIVMFFILPVLLSPIWINVEIEPLFRWVKLFSVIFAVVWFTIFRYTTLGEKNYFKIIAAAILIINILEAVIQDLSNLNLAGSLNAIAGILSIIALASWKDIKTDDNQHQDLIWNNMTMLWIIAYTVWNFVFVYQNLSTSAAGSIMVLLAAFIPAIFKKEIWMQARAFTLAIWMMYMFTFRDFMLSQVIYLPENDLAFLIGAVLSLTLNILAVVEKFKIKKGKAPLLSNISYRG